MKVSNRFRASKDVRLTESAAGDTPLRDDRKGKLKNGELKEKERAQTAELSGELSKLQEKLYASKNRKLLIILQGMDTAGKDGTVRALFSQLNPMGLDATGFVAPTERERAHDFLWRVHPHVPGNGMIAIWNRSHYEDVLVPRVNGDLDDEAVKRRYAQIRDFERLLHETGTTIVKLFLHISKDEQKARLQARLDDPEKYWKFDPNDLAVRAKWEAYQRAYEDAIVATNVDHAPWYVIPSDSKTHRNLITAHILLETVQDMDLGWPAPKADLAKVTID